MGERVRLPRAQLFTTTYWYSWACRAAVLGAASMLGARVLLSPRASEGVLPRILEAEGLAWRVVAIG